MVATTPVARPALWETFGHTDLAKEYRDTGISAEMRIRAGVVASKALSPVMLDRRLMRLSTAGWQPCTNRKFVEASAAVVEDMANEH
jgi:hypothetical protein